MSCLAKADCISSEPLESMVNKKIVPMSFSDDLFKHVDPVQRQANAIPSLLGMTLYSYTGVISRDQLSRNQLS